MQRRFLLAFVISFLILSLWSQFFSPKKPVNNTQVVGNKDVVTVSTEQVAAVSPLADTTLPLKEEIKRLENSDIAVDFTNIGPAIKTITIKSFNVTLPVDNILATSLPNSATVVLEQGNNFIVYVTENQNTKILSKFILDPKGYKVKASFQVINKGTAQQNVSLMVNALSLDNSRLDKETENGPNKALLEYSVANGEKLVRKGNAYKFAGKENVHETKSVRWVGFRDRYFCLVVKPGFPVVEYEVKEENEKRLSINFHSDSKALAAGESREFGLDLYFGPQRLNVLKSYKLGFEEIMAFSNFGIIDAIAKGIYMLLDFIHKFIPNLGVCIIVISSFIYMLTYPLTFKSMLSMKRMQAIQPELTKIREQYKDNPQKLNKEMMDLYKKNKVNPLGGCLPMLLQMPIFIGLYQVLWRSVSFKGASFLWIKDLSEPDRLMIFNHSLPIIGNELNILPLLMMVVMFFQQKLSSKNMVVMDPSQATQQKMMMYFMPLMIGFLFYKFASGLSLYFTIFYLLSTLSQWKMSKINFTVAS